MKKQYNELFKLSTKLFYSLFAFLLIAQILIIDFILSKLHGQGWGFLEIQVLDKTVQYWITIAVPIVAAAIISILRTKFRIIFTKSLDTTFNNFRSTKKNVYSLKSELNSYIKKVRNEHVKNNHGFSFTNLREYTVQFISDHKKLFDKTFLDENIDWNNQEMFLVDVLNPLKVYCTKGV